MPRPRSSWSLLRHLAEARIVTSMYVWLLAVPLLARFLSKLSGAATLTVFDHQFQVDFHLPFTWQVFYFSALSFTLGNIVYFLRCPRIVQDHATAHDFRAAGKGIDQLTDYAKDAAMPNDALMAAIKEVERQYKSDDARFHDLFWQVHRHADRQRVIALASASLAYGIGLLLITWVFVENFLAVVARVL